MTEDLHKETSSKMDESINALMSEFRSLGFDRANPEILKNITITTYGQKIPLRNIASITVLNNKSLSINVWDKSNVNLVDKAIRTSKLGLNPRIEDNKLLITLPSLTTDRKREFIKMAKNKAENAKVAIRGHRRLANESLKKLNKSNDLSDDELTKGLKIFQILTDKKIDKVETLLKNKEKSLLDF